MGYTVGEIAICPSRNDCGRLPLAFRPEEFSVFKTWNIVDHHLYAGNTGHYYWECKAIASELLSRGMNVRIFASKSAPAAAQFPGSRVYPTFSQHSYRIPNNTWGKAKNFLVSGRLFSRDLSQAQRTLFHGSLSYLPNVSGPSQLIPLIRWLMHFEDPVGPESLLLWNPTSVACIKSCGGPAQPGSKNLVLMARSTDEANQFHRVMGVRPYVLPSPVGPSERRAQIAANAEPSAREMVVSFMAGCRYEKGFMLIPEVVKLCKSLKIQFFIQANNDGCSDVDEAHFRLLTDLRGLPNVELHVGTLERDAYYDAIARSVVLIPYAPSSYRWRTSGVYDEAKYLGAPVIVAAGSWIADEVKTLGNGLVFEI